LIVSDLHGSVENFTPLQSSDFVPASPKIAILDQISKPFSGMACYDDTVDLSSRAMFLLKIYCETLQKLYKINK